MKFASRPVKGRDETELDRIGSISKKLVGKSKGRGFPISAGMNGSTCSSCGPRITGRGRTPSGKRRVCGSPSLSSNAAACSSRAPSCRGRTPPPRIRGCWPSATSLRPSVCRAGRRRRWEAGSDPAARPLSLARPLGFVLNCGRLAALDDTTHPAECLDVLHREALEQMAIQTVALTKAQFLEVLARGEARLRRSAGRRSS
jgi:hypothetical protein